MASTASKRGIDLKSHAAMLKRRWVTIVAVVVGVVVVALAYSLHQAKAYEAKSQVLILPRGAQSAFSSANDTPNAPFSSVETEAAVLNSDPVRSLVRARVGSAPKVVGSRVGQTEVMQITATTPTATEAARVANAYADAYIEVRRNQEVDSLNAASAGVRDKIATIQHQLDAMDAQIAASPSSQRSDVQNALRARYQTLLDQQSAFQQKADELDVDASLKSGGAELVKRATVPHSPIRPQPIRNGLVALAGGLLLGVGAAYAREHFDDSIKNKDELAEAGAAPVLGLIPVARSEDGAQPVYPGVFDGGLDPPTAEAYRALRTAVTLLGVDRPLRTIQVTSPVAGEGKTSTVAGLGLMMALAGQRVVMVDADLRQPRLHEVFGVANGNGLTSLFAEGGSPVEFVAQVAGVPSLFLLTAGVEAPNPSELVGSRRMAEVLFHLSENFDAVLIDSPPVLPVTDATVLAAWVDAVLLVAKAGSTTTSQVADAVELLRQVDVQVNGSVLNRVVADSRYGYRYRYAPERDTATAAPEPSTSPPLQSPEWTGNGDLRERRPVEVEERRP